MFDSPDLLKQSDELRIPFKSFRIIERVYNPEVKSTPNQPPATTLSTRLTRSKPQLYLGRDENGKKVAIKAVYQSSYYLLENEWKALDLLKWRRIIPWEPNIAPVLISNMELDYKRQIYFIVYEWMDGWICLGELINQIGPLSSCDDALAKMTKLRNALISTINCLHRISIVHGDLKDEHIYIKKQPEKGGICQISFNQIKIIDFGGCYLQKIEDWKGGSLGFSSPYFWEQNHRHLLSAKELKSIDWYGVHAILYYAYTGECFPAASPAFGCFSLHTTRDSAQNYYRELKSSLFYKWQNQTKEVQNILAETIEYLCSPDLIIIP